MGYKFATVQDVQRRLDDTICKYMGVPYYVRANNLNHTVSLFKIDDTKADAVYTNVDYTANVFDFGFPEIGYINHNANAYYIERFSGRDQRMGLPRNLIMYVHGKVPTPLFRSKGMENMLLNIYPDVKEAVRLIKDIGSTSVAISRDYALDRNEKGDLDVMYHDKIIATASKEGGTYRIRWSPHVKRISFFVRHFSKWADELNQVG